MGTLNFPDVFFSFWCVKICDSLSSFIYPLLVSIHMIPTLKLGFEIYSRKLSLSSSNHMYPVSRFPFLVPRSPFVVRRSPFPVPRSPFLVLRFSFPPCFVFPFASIPVRPAPSFLLYPILPFLSSFNPLFSRFSVLSFYSSRAPPFP